MSDPLDKSVVRLALESRPTALLLDFDGPCCSVFARLDRGQLMAEIDLALAPLGTRLPPSVRASGDPMLALSWAVDHGSEVLVTVDFVVTSHEVAGAVAASPTPGLDELVRAAHCDSVPIAVVTNNSPDAVRAFLGHSLPRLTDVVVVGRSTATASRMKPAPDYLLAALDHLGVTARLAVLVGDSVSDVEASRAAGVVPVGLARSDKRSAELRTAGAAQVVRSLTELVVAGRRES